ncbi:hypothetical protein SAMN04488067_12019 [Halorubrum xinjiangense]|uniref:Uncharacterized protein n=1 Tax=Halorubrum xinjiangense TaxID=261291 RepID=A0A1G7SDG9_9EURY|nr:hypothetical protein SAMN04488067_12019 [Halorubrum xinjiangense]
MFAYNVIICLELFLCSLILEIHTQNRHISAETRILRFCEKVFHEIAKLSGE